MLWMSVRLGLTWCCSCLLPHVPVSPVSPVSWLHSTFKKAQISTLLIPNQRLLHCLIHQIVLHSASPGGWHQVPAVFWIFFFFLLWRDKRQENDKSWNVPRVEAERCVHFSHRCWVPSLINPVAQRPQVIGAEPVCWALRPHRGHRLYMREI